MRKDILLIIFSLFFLIAFNISLMNIRMNITYLKNTIILLVLSILLLSIFIYFSEKIKNKYLLILNLITQIFFSVKDIYLSIFLIPIILLFFENGEKAISISTTILFLIFFFLPVIYQPFQNALMNYAFSTFNVSLDKMIENAIKQQVTVDVNYTKSLVLYGFDYAVQNLQVSNYSLVEELRNNLSEEIDAMGNETYEMYIQDYKDVLKQNIVETINKYKVFISMAISLSIFTTVYVYFLFVKLYYHLFKSLLDKYL